MVSREKHWKCGKAKIVILPIPPPPHSVTHFSETSIQVDWKTKAQRSRLNKEIINNECVLSSLQPSKRFSASSIWSTLGGEISVYAFFFSANYLGSTHNTLSSLRHVPLWHSILLLKEKNEVCVGALIQHLFKQTKSQWKFWRRNLLVPLWLTCHPKTQ